MTVSPAPWWKDSVVYQIYPASFNDSNDDGIGDIPGIIQKLDYIKSLGANVVWVCPMYDSPQIDMGYDVRDYKEVYAPYGTLSDMEELIQKAHAKDMRIILDLVINHTSSEHAWFKESRSSKTNSKRDWYIWKPARYDEQGQRQPPNNWRSNFEGSAWEWDEATQEYYLHLFCPEQPDLNWENEETRRAIYQDAMIFWLEKGVDGFRVDTVNMYSKDPSYPDAPVTDPDSEWQPAGLVYCNGPRMHEFLREMNDILSRYDAMSVGECPHTPDMGKVVKYVSAKEKQLNMVFQFDVVDVGTGTANKFPPTPHAWKLPELKEALERTQTLCIGNDAWTTAFMENHDQARSISRFGDDSPTYRVRSGKMLALMLATLTGTLYIYQGQEIGMINIPMDWPLEEYKDVESGNYYRTVEEHNGGDRKKLDAAKAALQHMARDNARTPMQWDASSNGGFCSSSVTPWMRVNSSTKTINVEQQLDDKESVLAFWQHMLALRTQYSDLFVHGDFELVDKSNESVLCFTKRFGNRQAVVVCNFSSTEQKLPSVGSGTKLDYLAGNVDSYGDDLQPWEGRVLLERSA